MKHGGRMHTTHDTDLTTLNDVTRHLRAALESIADDQWSLATPCIEWNLSALVDHITGGNWFTTRILAGHPAEEAMRLTMKRFAGGSATRDQALESVDDQLAAFRQPAALERSWSHVAGTLTGRQILRLRLHDLIVHTWDVEATVRPPAVVPDNLARWGLDELTSSESLTVRHFELTDDHVPTTEASSADYLRTFGR